MGPSLVGAGSPRRPQRVDLASALRHEPLPVVLDTSTVRTGLQSQMKTGRLPMSVGAIDRGAVRMFMERDTLVETWARLPRFAAQLGVPVGTLRAMFSDDWLPRITVIALPPDLRALDGRAIDVRSLDADDYPAAALAALLAPSIILTLNHKDFGPLGVTKLNAGVAGVGTALELADAAARTSATLMVPILPVLAARGAARWSVERIGPVTWLILGVAAGAGAGWLGRLPAERRKELADIGKEGALWILEQLAEAGRALEQAQDDLVGRVVPKPAQAIPLADVMRLLAVCPTEALTAQQIYDRLDAANRPPVGLIRAFLHAHRSSVVSEVRRGFFKLGTTYVVA